MPTAKKCCIICSLDLRWDPYRHTVRKSSDLTSAPLMLESALLGFDDDDEQISAGGRRRKNSDLTSAPLMLESASLDLTPFLTGVSYNARQHDCTQSPR